MKLAWKEMKKSKIKFFILGSIFTLISLLTFIVSGLANGLSQDNASFIHSLPDGEMYYTKEAKDSYNLSQIPMQQVQQIQTERPEATAFSIQMGFLKDDANEQGVSFVTTTDAPYFPTVERGEIVVNESLKEKGFQIGDQLTSPFFDGSWTLREFVKETKFSHAPVAYISMDDFQSMYKSTSMQVLFIPGDSNWNNSSLQKMSKEDFLSTIPSYSAEQLTLSMIQWFLLVISGLLFAIFFYMMNVQKVGLYGILKAIGMKTSALFRMMWTQMILITVASITISIAFSQTFQWFAPEQMPFHLPLKTIGLLTIVFFVIGFIGATLSGWQIKRIAPLQAIQRGEM